MVFNCGFLELIIVGGICEVVTDLMMLEIYLFIYLRNKLELDGMIYLLVIGQDILLMRCCRIVDVSH